MLIIETNSKPHYLHCPVSQSVSFISLIQPRRHCHSCHSCHLRMLVINKVRALLSCHHKPQCKWWAGWGHCLGCLGFIPEQPSHYTPDTVPANICHPHHVNNNNNYLSPPLSVSDNTVRPFSLSR